ncbi:hypothetical protein IMZ31_22180 (plasmid) [Pontibacillus sp. ALD_SL1]|uniref:hypothetical protein n=1 Tax=Pontibacillus sp. ALD_SL1 TaxID=2777185 RepID=UPI001A96B529|nr:hypothetical protein [Pontibacillus sp. ALD_SL1]QST02163.1 hypothetical protein IMZ31_22180 [Pontibacillus sp. ALD_SL1]
MNRFVQYEAKRRWGVEPKTATLSQLDSVWVTLMHSEEFECSLVGRMDVDDASVYYVIEDGGELSSEEKDYKKIRDAFENLLIKKVNEKDTTKELNVHMSMYMKYKGDKTKEELDEEFYKLVDAFCEKHDMAFQIYDSETQEI